MQFSVNFQFILKWFLIEPSMSHWKSPQLKRTLNREEKKNQRPKRHIAMRLSIQLIIHFMLHISIQHFECESFVGAHIGRMILLFNISSEFVRLFVHSLESTKPSKQFHLGWFPILMRFYSYFRLDDLLNAFFLHIFNSLLSIKFFWMINSV